MCPEATSRRAPAAPECTAATYSSMWGLHEGMRGAQEMGTEGHVWCVQEGQMWGDGVHEIPRPRLPRTRPLEHPLVSVCHCLVIHVGDRLTHHREFDVLTRVHATLVDALGVLSMQGWG